MQNCFLLGNPRSGTSLLRIMLNSHARIVAPPESGFMQWWYSKYNDWNIDDANRRVETFVSDLLTSKKIEAWKLDKNLLIQFIKERQPVNYAELTSLIYLFWGGLTVQPNDMIVDKNNYYIKHLNELLLWWPNAKFIVLVRDGRDVACSYMDLQNLKSNSPYKPNLPFQIADIATEWNNNNLSLLHYGSSLPEGRFMLVKYEDVILNTVDTLKRICRFLNVLYSADMLNYYETNDEPLSTIDWKRKTLEKPDVTNIGKYKNQLTNEQVATFNRIASEALSLLGY